MLRYGKGGGRCRKRKAVKIVVTVPWQNSCPMWQNDFAHSVGKQSREIRLAGQESFVPPPAGDGGGPSIRNRSTGKLRG